MTSATSLGRRLVFFLLSQRPVMLSRGSGMCWGIPCVYGFLRACSRRSDGSREVPEGDDLGACFDDRTRTGTTPMVRYIRIFGNEGRLAIDHPMAATLPRNHRF